MCGGNKPAFDRVEPLLKQMGQTITYTGPSGNGQLTKLVNQILVLGTLLAVSEAMVFAKRSGLDLSTTLKAVGSGAARSWQLEVLGPKIIQQDFAPGFMVDLASKDLQLVIEFARENHIHLPGVRWVQQLYRRLQQMGCGREGTQALFKIVEQLQSSDPGSPALNNIKSE
jgi:3-hydroxyisobutyrate dehydrogenase